MMNGQLTIAKKLVGAKFDPYFENFVYLIHSKHFELLTFLLGLLLFYIGMAINIHSNYILRNLRKPGEVVYKIPTGKKLRSFLSNLSFSLCLY